MFRLLTAAIIVTLATGALSQTAPSITQESMNGAGPNGANDTDPSLIAKGEVLLDRSAKRH